MNRKHTQRTAYVATAASLVVLVAACGSSTKTVVRTVRVKPSEPTLIVLSKAQARAVGRLAASPSEPSDPEPAVVVVSEGPGLTINADVTYYCSENPGKVYFRITERGTVRVLDTSAALEGESGVQFCAPQAAK